MTSQAPPGRWGGGWMRKLPVFLLFMEASEKKHEVLKSSEKKFWKETWIHNEQSYLKRNSSLNYGKDSLTKWKLMQ